MCEFGRFGSRLSQISGSIDLLWSTIRPGKGGAAGDLYVMALRITPSCAGASAPALLTLFYLSRRKSWNYHYLRSRLPRARATKSVQYHIRCPHFSTFWNDLILKLLYLMRSRSCDPRRSLCNCAVSRMLNSWELSRSRQEPLRSRANVANLNSHVIYLAAQPDGDRMWRCMKLIRDAAEADRTL